MNNFDPLDDTEGVQEFNDLVQTLLSEHRRTFLEKWEPTEGDNVQ